MNDMMRADIEDVEKQVVGLLDEDLSPEERWRHDSDLVRKLAVYDTATRNLFLWTAGCVLSTLKDDPEKYGMEDTPTQEEFGRQYMNGASRATVQRALKLYDTYDQSFITDVERLTQQHLLVGVDVPEPERESVLKEVETDLASGKINSSDGVKRIQQKAPSQDEEKIEDGGTEDKTSDQQSDRGEPSEVGQPEGSLSEVQFHLAKAYRSMRDYDDKFGPDQNLTAKQKDVIKEIGGTASELADMAQNLSTIG